MTDVKSKNLYELLGNDHDQDSDKEPEPPVKTVEKPLPRSGKRDAPKTEPAAVAAEGAAPRRNYERRGGGFTDGDRSFRDRTNARNNPNRDNPVENTDGTVRGRDSGPGTQRGGRGQRGPRRGGDRHVNRSGRAEHEKQTDQAWGQPTGEGEQEDEKLGEQIAQEDRKEAVAEEAVDAAPEPEPEPEDTSISYADYLAQQAAKKLEGLGLKEARAANEGSKENKQWKSATQLAKEKEEENYFIGEAKARRERERVAKKQVLDIDYSFKEQPREGGRGGARGGRGRGEGRGRGRGRGDGEFRPRGDRGGDRGDRGDRGERGSYRGGRGRSDAAPAAINDAEAYPALGS